VRRTINWKGITSAVLAAFALSPLCPAAEDGPYKPTEESLKQYRAPEWFRDAKFGIWAHWGPQAVPEDGDWYSPAGCTAQTVRAPRPRVRQTAKPKAHAPMNAA
jgi:hypothetical protein